MGIVPVFWSDAVEKAPRREPLTIDVRPAEEYDFAELAFVRWAVPQAASIVAAFLCCRIFAP